MRKIRSVLNRVGIGRAIALVLLFNLLLLRIWDPAPIEALRHRGFDLYQSIQPRAVTARPVVIVDIDEPSLRELGQWPWPRTIVAAMIDRITSLGAVAVGFDVIFAEPDRVSPGVAAASFAGLDEATRAKLLSLPSNDAILADALRRGRVVVGQSGYRDVTLDPAAAPPVQTGFATVGPDPQPWLVTFPHLLRNVPALEEAAAGRGLFSIRSERDGVVRRVPMVMNAGGVMVPSLALELLRVVTRSDAILVRSDAAGVNGVAVPGLAIPTDRNGQLWVHFGPHDATRFVSAKDLLAGAVPADRFAGKLVLIGTSAVGLLDLKTTPVDPSMPGVEIHAQVLETLLTQSALSVPSYATLAELVIALLLGLALIGLAPRVGPGTLFWLGGMIAVSLAGLSWYYFSYLHLLIDATYPLASSFSVYLALVFTNYVQSSTERRRIRSAFRQYLAPALVEQLAQSPDKLRLGGEERRMTILFSDVRGFTRISETYKRDPQGLTALMNRLLTPLTNRIIEREGTIDKYMGDAIMAFWNAPLDVPDHERKACEAALAMIASLDELNAVREREAEAAGQPFHPMRIGIGLNTGHCVVGNMGSDLHFNYSVLGDAVNLASRLEGQSAFYGVRIVLGSATAAAVANSFAVLELDRIQVKGKTDPEVIHCLLGGPEVAAGAPFAHLTEVHGSLLAAYRSRDWPAALQALLLCRDAGRPFDLDPLYELYLGRIRQYVEAPPPDDWDGVYVAVSK